MWKEEGFFIWGIKLNTIKKNYIYNLFYQIITIILPIITVPYVSRVLGVESIGIYSYTNSIVTYFTIFANLGINMYGQREIAYYQNNERQQIKILFELVVIRIGSTLCSLLIFVTFLLTNIDNKIVYLVHIPTIVAVMFDISWFYQGLENYKFVVARNVYIKVAGIVSIFIFVREYGDLINYVLCLSVITLMTRISLWSEIIKKLSQYRGIKLELRRHAKTIFALFIPQIIVQLYTVFDKTLLGILGQSSAESGYYEQAEKIARLVACVVSTFSIVMMPRISNLYYSGKRQQACLEIKNSFRFVWFLGIPIMLGLIGVSEELTLVFLGEQYEKVSILLSILSIIVLMVGLNNVTGMQYFIPMKKQRNYTISVTVGAFIDIILNIVLIPHLKSIGTAISIVVAETVITIIQFYYMNREISVKKIIIGSWKYCIAGIIMLAVTKGMSYPINEIKLLVTKIISGSLVYFFILLVLREEIVLNEIRKLKNLLK